MFWGIFLKLCSDNGESPNSLAKKLNISSGAVTTWKNGTVPRNNTLKKLSDYFGVTVDYLLGKESSTPDSEWTIKTEQEKVLITSFRSTTEEGRQRIIQSVLNICDALESADK